MKLIDKDALVAEIEKLKYIIMPYPTMAEKVAYRDGIEDTIKIVIKSLEVKEVNEVPANVMLNQFGNKYISSWSGLKEYDNFQINEEIKILIPNK